MKPVKIPRKRAREVHEEVGGTKKKGETNQFELAAQTESGYGCGAVIRVILALAHLSGATLFVEFASHTEFDIREELWSPSGYPL